MIQFLTILLFANTIIAFGQTHIDFEQIANSWSEGKIDQNGKVVRADVNKAGCYHLNINKDTTVVFGDAFTCGFGKERQGKWKLNERDTTISCLFSKRTGYINNPKKDDINETDIYKIVRLTENELILTQLLEGNNKTFQFIKTRKE